MHGRSAGSPFSCSVGEAEMIIGLSPKADRPIVVSSSESELPLVSSKDAHVFVTSNPFAALSEEIVVHILQYLSAAPKQCSAGGWTDAPLPSLIQQHQGQHQGQHQRQHQGQEVLSINDFRPVLTLAACDTFLRYSIYRGLPCLWKEIPSQFYGHDIIDDSFLGAWLQRINAGSVLQRLSLKNCCISGIGLLPLMGARELEMIDLRGISQLDWSLVNPILQSMLPYKLRIIKISNDRGYRPHEFLRTAVMLLLAKVQSVYESKEACKYCRQPFPNTTVCPTLLDDVANVNVRCSVCSGISCGALKSSCCPQICACVWCQEPCCVECTVECTPCHHNICKACLASASKPADRFADVCCECNTMYCDLCHSIEFCASCDRCFCIDCEILSDCMGCDKSGFCSDCLATDECVVCQIRFCQDCASMTQCSVCDALHCPQCTVTCERCNAKGCFECITSCSGCNQSLCCDSIDQGLIYCGGANCMQMTCYSCANVCEHCEAICCSDAKHKTGICAMCEPRR